MKISVIILYVFTDTTCASLPLQGMISCQSEQSLLARLALSFWFFLLQDAGYHICPLDHIKHLQFTGYKNQFFCTGRNSPLFLLCLSFNKVINISLSPRERPDVEAKLSFTDQRWRKDDLEAERVRLIWGLLFDLPEQALGLCICFEFPFQQHKEPGAAAGKVERSQVATT